MSPTGRKNKSNSSRSFCIRTPLWVRH